MPPVKSSWSITAATSSPYKPADLVIDGIDYFAGINELYWTSGPNDNSDEWVQIDFGVEVKVFNIVLFDRYSMWLS